MDEYTNGKIMKVWLEFFPVQNDNQDSLQPWYSLFLKALHVHSLHCENI